MAASRAVAAVLVPCLPEKRSRCARRGTFDGLKSEIMAGALRGFTTPMASLTFNSESRRVRVSSDFLVQTDCLFATKILGRFRATRPASTRRRADAAGLVSRAHRFPRSDSLPGRRIGPFLFLDTTGTSFAHVPRQSNPTHYPISPRIPETSYGTVPTTAPGPGID